MYFVALVVIALMLGPVLYIIIGGFRTNSQITVDPSGLPVSWNPQNYVDVLTGGVFWQRGAQLDDRRASRPPSARWCSDSWPAT